MDDLEQIRLIGRLERETIFIRENKKYGKVTYDIEDGRWVHISRFPIGPQWMDEYVEILIDIPQGTPGYPFIPPDWFWIDASLRTRDGKKLRNFFTEEDEKKKEYQEYYGKGWGHFCLHMKTWHPITGRNTHFTSGDSLVSFLNAVSVVFQNAPRVRGE